MAKQVGRVYWREFKGGPRLVIKYDVEFWLGRASEEGSGIWGASVKNRGPWGQMSYYSTLNAAKAAIVAAKPWEAFGEVELQLDKVLPLPGTKKEAK